MLLTKPVGMCTVSGDALNKTVTLGFHESEQAQAFRNHVVDKVIQGTQGRTSKVNIKFTDEERESATAQTIVETIEQINHQAEMFEKMGNPVIAGIFRDHAKKIEDEINASLGRS